MEGYEQTGTSVYYEEYADDNLWLIDDDRNIVAPRESINLEGETRSQYIPFQISRYQDGIDLAEKYFTIIYNLEDGDADSVPAVNSYFDDSHVIFGWLVDGNVTKKSQSVSIQIQATGKNEKDEDYVYRTHIKALKIDVSLKTDTIISEEPDLYNGFMNYITSVLSGETGVVFARVSRTLTEFSERISAIAASGTASTDNTELADARVRKNGTSATSVGDELRAKADAFVIEDNKLYLLSGGVKITEGIEITTDLSGYLTTTDAKTLLKDYIPVSDNSGIVSNVEKSANGLTITMKDGSPFEVEIDTSTAKAFETVSFDEDARTLHFYDTDGADVYDPVYIAGGGSSGSTTTTSRVVLTNETVVGDSTAVTVPVADGKTAVLKYKFESYDSSGEITAYSGTAQYTVNGTVVQETNISQGSISFDCSSYISQGRNTVRVKVTDEDGNYATKTWTVMSYALSMKDSLDDGDIQTGELLYKYTPTGQLDKTIHFKVDGTEVATATVTTSGRQQTQTIPAQIHGSHTLEVYATADVNGVTITSNVLTHDIIWIEDGNTNPIVASSWSGSVVQYSTAAIPFLVYTPGSLTSSVILSVDGTQVSKRTVDRTLQTWSYRPQEAGTKVLTITSGTATRTINLVVEDAGIEITPVTSGRVCDLNPQGHSNDDDDLSWADNGITTTVSEGFDWTNGGYQLDEDGNTCFIVKAGDTLTVNYNLFGDDARKTGKAFNFNFMTQNVSDYDAEVLSCMSGDVGLQMNAQNATMKSEQTTIDVPYCEGKVLEFGLNILPDSEYPEIVIWLNGIPSRVVLYATNDSFTQTTPVPITIGSADCDVVIYRIQPYTISLTDDEQMDNFVANGKNTDEIVERYNRNDICDDYGNIDPDKLAQAFPGLRVLELTCPRFTNGKKDTVTGATLKHTMVSGGNAHTWTSGAGLEFKGQGTSSEYYGDSARNLDFSFKGGFYLADGTHIDKYAMTDNSVAVNTVKESRGQPINGAL